MQSLGQRKYIYYNSKLLPPAAYFAEQCGVGCPTCCTTTWWIPLLSYKSNRSEMFLLGWLRHFNEATQYSVTCNTSWSPVYQLIVLSSCCLCRIYYLIISWVKLSNQIDNLMWSHKVLYNSLGRATCTLLFISAPDQLQWNEYTKAKVLLRYYCLDLHIHWLGVFELHFGQLACKNDSCKFFDILINCM